MAGLTRRRPAKPAKSHPSTSYLTDLRFRRFASNKASPAQNPVRLFEVSLTRGMMPPPIMTDRWGRAFIGGVRITESPIATQYVRIALLERAVLTVPINIPALIYHRAPGGDSARLGRSRARADPSDYQRQKKAPCCNSSNSIEHRRPWMPLWVGRTWPKTTFKSGSFRATMDRSLENRSSGSLWKDCAKISMRRNGYRAGVMLLAS